MRKHLYIVTGASRGMGYCLAEQLLAADHLVLCISRQQAPALTRAAQQRNAELLQWCADLVDTQAGCQQLAQWLGTLDVNALASATLINNAGVIPPLVPLRGARARDLAQGLRVGLEAPLLLASTFLAATCQWPLPRKVLNISSGLGRRAMASLAAYCAAKAGMDHFTRCLALEEARLDNGAKVCSLAPGVIETDMQRQLRLAQPADFPDQPGFAQLHETGQLSAARDAAARVLQYLHRPDFGSEPVADVRR